jgi:hypothetical protein
MRDDDPRAERDTDDLLAGIPVELEPPVELRGHVVDTLRERGLVRSVSAIGSRLRYWAVTVAAALVAFLGGRMTASPPEPVATAPAASVETTTTAPEGTPGLQIPEGRSAWAFLLYEDARFDAGDRSLEEVVRIYDAWGSAAAAAGVLLLGEKFADEETLLVEGQATARPLGAAAPPGMLGGMFVVAAPTQEAALALARETPHHEMGGIVLMREIDRIDR